MNVDKKELSSLTQSVCKEIEWAEIIFAGIVGSALVTLRNRGCRRIQ